MCWELFCLAPHSNPNIMFRLKYRQLYALKISAECSWSQTCINIHCLVFFFFFINKESSHHFSIDWHLQKFMHAGSCHDVIWNAWLERNAICKICQDSKRKARTMYLWLHIKQWQIGMLHFISFKSLKFCRWLPGTVVLLTWTWAWVSSKWKLKHSVGSGY